MISACRPTATLALLALVLGVIPGILAIPVTSKTTDPELDITTSIPFGKPILGEEMGPFLTGNALTITCSTKSPDPVQLSWWEDEVEMEAVGSDASASFTLSALRMTDSRRRFTCKDKLSGRTKSVKLQVVTMEMNILRDEENLQDHQTLAVEEGEGCTLTCVVQGYKPPPATWCEGNKHLAAINEATDYASSSVLQVSETSIGQEGHTFTCQTLGGQLTRTVVVRRKTDKDEVAPTTKSVSETSKAITTATPSSRGAPKTITTIATPSSRGAPKTIMTIATPSSRGAPKTITTIATPSSKGAPKSITTATTLSSTAIRLETSSSSIGQGSPVMKEKMYIMVGVSVIAFIGIAVISFIIVILNMNKKIDRMSGPSSAPHEGNSSELQDMSGTTSEQSTLESLDPNDLPAVTPLLARPPPVDEGRETARSGGRMSVAMLDDRDHSYYYPDLTNNSYYYPKISDNVRANILKTNTNL